MLKALSPLIGVVCPKINFFDTPDTVQFAGYGPLATFPDGRLVSFLDKGIEITDSKTGSTIARLEHYSENYRVATVLPNGSSGNRIPLQVNNSDLEPKNGQRGGANQWARK